MNERIELIKEILTDRLQGTQAKLEVMHEKHKPLFLLLTTNFDLAVFAFITKDTQISYTNAYNVFKNLYEINSTSWEKYDLSLVLYPDSDFVISEETKNTIEIEPYFCRKFLVRNQYEIDSLSFLPLRIESLTQERPTTALTLLTHLNIDADLSRSLTLPHKKSPEKIKEECLERNVIELNLDNKDFQAANKLIKGNATQNRFKNIEITNFRAYKGKHLFDLDADLIVLYGPNGFGKTSFFDAIDFLCTGGIGRFDERYYGKTEKLKKIFKHLDSTEEESSHVSGTMQIGDKLTVVRRSVEDRIGAYFNDIKMNRSEFLTSISDLIGETDSLRIDNLVQIFRATHLFQQDYSNIKFQFHEHSKLPDDIVARIFAVQDYVEGINKTEKVSYIFSKEREEEEKKIILLDEQLSLKGKELKELKRVKIEAQSQKNAEKLHKEILEKLKATINEEMLDVPTGFKLDTVKQWRSLNDYHINRNSEKLDKLVKLETEYQYYTDNKKKLDDLTKEYEETNLKIKKLENRAKEVIAPLSNFRNEQNQLNSKEKTLSQIQNLEWALKSKDLFHALSKEIVTIEAKNKLEQSSQDSIKNQIEASNNKIKKLKETREAQTTNRQKLIEKLDKLRFLEDDMSNFSTAIQNSAILEESILTVKETINNLAKQKEISQIELKRVSGIGIQYQERINGLHKEQTKLSNLLDQIEIFINDSVCPVCGEDHKEKDALLRRISTKKGKQPRELQELNSEFKNTERIQNELKKNIEKFQIDLLTAQSKLDKLQTEIVRANKKKSEFIDGLNKMGISNTDEIGLEIIRLKEVASKEVLTTDNAIKISEKSLQEEQALCEKFIYEFNSKIKEQSGLGVKIEELRKSISNFDFESDLRGVGLNLSSEEITEKIASLKKDYSELLRSISLNLELIKKIEDDSKQLLFENAELQKALQLKSSSLAKLKNQINSYQSIVNGLGFNNQSFSLAEVKNAKDITIIEKGVLENLKEKISSLEMLLNDSQLSLIAAKVNDEIKVINKQIKEQEILVEKYKKWEVVFKKIHNKLQSQKNSSVSNFITHFGPLSSIIQKRLRLFYGFEGIVMNVAEENISIHVKRKGEEFQPSDYFSEAQIQIVLLSLFLSIVLTQSWSNFTPILLDDPITHFDDFNAYSFIDIIRNILSNENEKRQIIISTCESRLFRLMKDRLCKMENKAIFYEFESLGDSGPKIIKHL